MSASGKFRLSRRAIRDLATIFRFISEKDPIAAQRLVNSLESKIAALARINFPGVSREQFAPGLRAFPYKSHCIYFHVEENHLHVVRILHGRQDVSSQDFPESET
ncbi:type II toxin-antitoxin system RelE/ParE family toxin [Pararhizobium arenae]|uniref:type II toxin-antitoxin system RelE/ParE family toxin n=1 Tax=Pararhizobium arenae TaxID=1856850 RepID=UPI00094B442E|nr:type II toxin-antitoxin system RelE/ParE family toxin [Pararhizobium arenae]